MLNYRECTLLLITKHCHLFDANIRAKNGDIKSFFVIYIQTFIVCLLNTYYDILPIF